MVAISNLSAEKRESVGKGNSRSLRREGRIPAVIYGDKLEPLTISLSERDLNAELRKEGFYYNEKIGFYHYKFKTKYNRFLIL